MHSSQAAYHLNAAVCILISSHNCTFQLIYQWCPMVWHMKNSRPLARTPPLSCRYPEHQSPSCLNPADLSLSPTMLGIATRNMSTSRRCGITWWTTFPNMLKKLKSYLLRRKKWHWHRYRHSKLIHLAVFSESVEYKYILT